MKKSILLIVLLYTQTIIAQNECKNLKINEIQVLGTHNSYARPVDRKVLDFVSPILSSMMEKYMENTSAEQKAKFQEYHPNGMDFSEGLNYNHPDFTKQLNANLRSLEIDVYYDPDGGRFMKPATYELLRQQGIEELYPHNTEGLEKPGFKVLHMADIDFRSHYPTLESALNELNKWSEQNPRHSPIFIMLEAKDIGFPLFPNSTKVEPFTKEIYDELDEVILQYLGKDKLITPAMIQGDYTSLKEAILSHKWPMLRDSRGKFVFLLQPGGAGTHKTDELPYLIKGSLKDRIMFMQSEPQDDFAAFILRDNAIVRQDEIIDLVQKGYLVRTRTDIETYEAKVNDYTRKYAAFSSGAQVISTDFFQPGNAYETDYFVQPPQKTDYFSNPVNNPCK